MYKVSGEDFTHFWFFLETLDCYIKSESGMIDELKSFDEDLRREIAALVCQNTSGRLTYTAPYIRIIYVLKGSVAVYLDNKKFLYNEGMLILANKSTKIEYQELSSETVVTGFYFKLNYFNNSLLNQFIEESMLYRFFVESTSYDTENVSHYFIYQFSTMDDVHFYILSLLKQVVKMCYFNNKLTKAAFVLLIVEMSQMTDSCLCLHDSDISNNVLAKEILNFIENNIRTVSLENISQKFHFHPNYLSALIKKETGCSYSEWLIKFRIDYAKKYLSQTDLSVQQIIEEVGYSDKTYFFKLFKEHINMTPGAYRKYIRKKNN